MKDWRKGCGKPPNKPPPDEEFLDHLQDKIEEMQLSLDEIARRLRGEDDDE